MSSVILFVEFQLDEFVLKIPTEIPPVFVEFRSVWIIFTAKFPLTVCTTSEESGGWFGVTHKSSPKNP
jgi:hypothetical protein